MNNLQQIGMALRLYAKDHDGHLPAALAQLEPEYLVLDSLQRMAFVSPDTKLAYAWLYFPQPDLNSQPEDAILAASPNAVPYRAKTPKRVVLHADGSVHWIPESDYQKRMAAQMKQHPAD